MNELELLGQFKDGRQKYSTIMNRMNVELSWSKFANKSAIITQIKENAHRDNFSVLYTVEETDFFDGSTQYVIHKEWFEKVKVAG
ncbi:hypothetical protein D3C87_737190 [compost metagenome]